ncbi:MAG: flagellar hook protein FlgE [Bradyrhizobium sp.]|nr:MAG: flagellar hook protein FlgE [Bradyrhizobium sp.]
MSLMGTAVSGMLGDTSWLSNISQNVANANTTGYKNAETEFATVVDQVGAASSAGGGVTASLRSLNTLQGSVVGTSTTTDLAIKGDGYFVVSDANGDLYLTRNGSFVPDADGNLINSAGYYLMGYNVQNGQSAGTTNSLAGLVKVNTITSGEAATPTNAGTLAVNLPSADATGTTEETSLVVYDNLGASHTIDLTFTNNGPNGSGGYTWGVTAADATAPATDLLGGTGLMTFNANGQLTAGTPLTFTVPNGVSMNLNVGQSTQLAASFGVNASTANGNAPSSLTGVTISTDGTLDFEYSNGVSSPGYDIPLATVASEDNLTAINGNAFQANQNSGTVRVGVAGTSGLGSIASSSLEDSTVDLATELTDMIQAQSAYQANSKVFQTGADLLDILNNLKS